MNGLSMSRNVDRVLLQTTGDRVHSDRTLGNINKDACLTVDVASIRVNCQIYVTSVMINTVIRFLLKKSTLPAVIFFICGISLSPMRAYYIRMLW